VIVLEPTQERLMTVKEVAALIGVTEGRVYQLLLMGRMSGVKVNEKAWLIPESEAKKFLNRPTAVGRPRSRSPQGI